MSAARNGPWVSDAVNGGPDCTKGGCSRPGKDPAVASRQRWAIRLASHSEHLMKKALSFGVLFLIAASKWDHSSQTVPVRQTVATTFSSVALASGAGV
jgi:hypothetical protein